MDGRRHVGGQRPGGGGPDQQPGVGATVDGQPHVDGVVLDLLVGIDELVLREGGAAAGAPGHGPLGRRDPAALVAALQEVPDVFDVGVGMGVVGVVPVHPLTEANGLAGLDAGEGFDAGAAGVGEGFQAKGFDVALGVEAQVFFDFNLQPEALAVEAVLVALVVAAHGPVTLVDVLVGAAPGVVHAHGVVGRDRAIEERPAWDRRRSWRAAVRRCPRRPTGPASAVPWSGSPVRPAAVRTRTSVS